MKTVNTTPNDFADAVNRAVSAYLASLRTDERHSFVAWLTKDGQVHVRRDWPKWRNGQPANVVATAVTSCDRNSPFETVARRIVADFVEEIV